MRIDLQLFAEKTERATPRRRADARKEGSVAHSSDVTTAASLIAAVAALKFFGAHLYSALWQSTTLLLSEGTSGSAPLSAQLPLLMSIGGMIVPSLIPIFAVSLLLGLGVAFAQVGPLFTVKPLLPDFGRINVIAGMGRLFSAKSMVELVKSVVKILLIGAASYMAVAGAAAQLVMLDQADPTLIFALIAHAAGAILLYVALLYIALAIADFYFQRFEFERSLRMSKNDLRDESKRFEGNPLIKRKIRERGRAIARRRMMQLVPQADVVITNPTHYAVALKYDAKTMHAPQVVAKGVDDTARRIREIAVLHDVPIVENQPLARSLYQLVQLEDYVPDQLFGAVAEVLAYVYRLRNRAL
ncbi:MAG: flagellar biosynthesis protein FlhB [Bacilli bacterium]